MNINFMRFIDRVAGIPICYLLSKGRGEKRPLPNKVRTIALIKMWGIGSIVLASPLMNAVRESFPRARIIFVSMKSNQGLYDRNRMFDERLYIDTGNPLSFLLTTQRVIAYLKEQRIDLLLDLEPIARFTTIITALAGPKFSIGFETGEQSRISLYDATVPYRNDIHITDTFLQMADLLGLRHSKGLIRPSITKKIKEKINGLLDRPFIVINPNVSQMVPERKWPAENFSELADHLMEKGRTVVLTGSHEDTENADRVIRRMKHVPVNLTAKLSLSELGYLLQKADLLITNDSGPLHIAEAVGCRSVSFFGPESPTLYGPKNGKVFYKETDCSPCISINTAKRVRCKKNARCIKEITLEEVTRCVDEMIR
ncbi:MAG: glycosyltransferase family 9 protein [archaeon]